MLGTLGGQYGTQTAPQPPDLELQGAKPMGTNM